MHKAKWCFATGHVLSLLAGSTPWTPGRFGTRGTRRWLALSRFRWLPGDEKHRIHVEVT